jgi:hypothetical protein
MYEPCDELAFMRGRRRRGGSVAATKQICINFTPACVCEEIGMGFRRFVCANARADEV